MRTFILLTALLLLAFQAQTQTLQETDDQVPAQDEPGDEDQDVAISFKGEERFTREAAGLPIVRTCRCRRGLSCKSTEHPSGKCSTFHWRYTRCCR